MTSLGGLRRALSVLANSVPSSRAFSNGTGGVASRTAPKSLKKRRSPTIQSREEVQKLVADAVRDFPELKQDTKFSETGLQVKCKAIDACIRAVKYNVSSRALGQITSLDDLVSYFWREISTPPLPRGPIDLDLPDNVSIDDRLQVHITQTKSPSDLLTT
eukprot:gb/GEZN01020536.1/.p1 GENE.gb/GEZN01020536.1/~~gb/GEZN01020536.1/.p1  ORF type:complete len:160 (-),score=20.77 gb/GEZN01020536.1/:170-649(-)